MINKEHCFNTFIIMIDIYPPTGPEKDPYSEIKTSETEKKREKEKFQTDSNQKKSNSLMGWSLIQATKKIVTKITRNKNSFMSPSSFSNELALLNDIMHFFTQLQKEALADDLESVTTFTQNWNLLMEAMSSLKKRSPPFLTLFDSLQHAINDFQGSAHHPLGYYLVEFQESEWIPSSLIELLNSLHHDYEKNPPLSHLTKWLGDLEELIKQMKKS